MKSASTTSPLVLRAEARLLATAGVMLLAIGFPLTIALAWAAMIGLLIVLVRQPALALAAESH